VTWSSGAKDGRIPAHGSPEKGEAADGGEASGVLKEEAGPTRWPAADSVDATAGPSEGPGALAASEVPVRTPVDAPDETSKRPTRAITTTVLPTTFPNLMDPTTETGGGFHTLRSVYCHTILPGATQLWPLARQIDALFGDTRSAPRPG